MSRRARAVPPVLTSSKPRATSAAANGTRPALSETERRALRATAERLGRERCVDLDTSAVDPEGSREKEPYGPRQKPMLHGVEALEERGLGVGGQDRHALGEDDRTAVESRVDEVHGGAGNGRARGQRVTHGVRTREGRKKRRVHVEDPTPRMHRAAPARRGA